MFCYKIMYYTRSIDVCVIKLSDSMRSPIMFAHDTLKIFNYTLYFALSRDCRGSLVTRRSTLRFPADQALRVEIVKLPDRVEEKN